jgi:hypothetical protein
MRENRPSGSEGGEPETNRASLPLSCALSSGDGDHRLEQLPLADHRRHRIFRRRAAGFQQHPAAVVGRLARMQLSFLSSACIVSGIAAGIALAVHPFGERLRHCVMAMGQLSLLVLLVQRRVGPHRFGTHDGAIPNAESGNPHEYVGEKRGCGRIDAKRHWTQRRRSRLLGMTAGYRRQYTTASLMLHRSMSGTVRTR